MVEGGVVNSERPCFSGEVRLAKEEDLGDIKLILEDWIRRDWFRDGGEIITEEVDEVMDSVRKSLCKGNARTYFVAEEGSKVVGMMGLLVPPKDKDHFVATEKPAELVNAFVDKNWRGGRGVGTALLRKIEEVAREKGHTEIILDSGPRYRFSGWGFYRRRGFEQVGSLKDYYGKDFDAQVFRKVL